MKKHDADSTLSNATTNTAPKNLSPVSLPAIAGFALVPLLTTAPAEGRLDERQAQSAVVEAELTELREGVAQQPIVDPGPGPIAEGSDGDAAEDARQMIERTQRVRMDQHESGSTLQIERDEQAASAAGLGDATPFGRGCGRLELATDTNSRAYTGNSSFHVLVEGTYQRGVSGMILATSALQSNGQRLPLDLGRMGLPGCNLYVALEQVLVQPETGDGIAAFHLPLPDDADLTGQSFYAQGFAVDATTGEVSMANAIQVVIGG